MKYLTILVISAGMMLCAQETKKAGLNFVFGGGFNTMKSWENYPDAPDNLDDIPGAGLIGLRAEYDFGQHMNFPHTYFFIGSDYPITQIGKLSLYDSLGTAVLTKYEYSHTTFDTEFGLSKKIYFEEFGIVGGISYLIHSMSVDKEANDGSFSETYKLGSGGFKGLVGINYNLGKAWFFELLVSYTGAGALTNDKDEKVFSTKDSYKIFEHFPFDDVKDDEYLTPNGLSVKIGMGLRI